jgi:hypothetical protein
MTKRTLLLVVLTAALMVPAVAIAADGGGGNPAAATGAKGARAGKVLDRVSARLDKRFQAFSSRCLVADPPKKCARAAKRFVRRLERAQRVLHKAEDTIKTKCAAPNPPARCSSAGEVTQKIDVLLGKIASDESAIKAAFPQAGSS